MTVDSKFQKSAQEMHKNIPPDWYYTSIKTNLFQRFWHNTRFSKVSALIDAKGGKILDIGCADGVFTQVILDKAQAHEIIGIDVLDSSIQWASKRWAYRPPMKFLVSDAHNLPFDEASFNGVFCLEMLEHVHDPKRVLSEIFRVLVPNGYAILLVPSNNLLFRFIWYFWTKYRGKVWYETHIQSFRNRQLSTLCVGIGFVIDKEVNFLFGMLYLLKVRKPHTAS